MKNTAQLTTLFTLLPVEGSKTADGYRRVAQVTRRNALKCPTSRCAVNNAERHSFFQLAERLQQVDRRLPNTLAQVINLLARCSNPPVYALTNLVCASFPEMRTVGVTQNDIERHDNG